MARLLSRLLLRGLKLSRSPSESRDVTPSEVNASIRYARSAAPIVTATISMSTMIAPATPAPIAVPTIAPAVPKRKLPIFSKNPSRGSDDFSHFRRVADTLFFDIGNGIGPDIHEPDYIFNDSIIKGASGLMLSVIRYFSQE